MKNTILKIGIVLFSFLPLIFRFPAIIQEWGRDIDGFCVNAADPFFMILGMITIFFLILHRRSEAGKMDLFAIPGVLCSLILLAFGGALKENAYFFLAAILLPSFVIWLLFGWRFFYRIFPVPLLFLLGLPTMLYLRFFPAITLNWKIAIASALCVYTFFALLTDFNPIRRQAAFFAFGVIVYALFYAAIAQCPAWKGTPFRLPGLKQIVPENTIPKPLEVSLRGDNVLKASQMHVKSAGYDISLLKLNCRTLSGHDYVLYTWFSSDKHFSTGDYALFRYAAKDGSPWFVSTIRSDDPDRDFSALLKERLAE